MELELRVQLRRNEFCLRVFLQVTGGFLLLFLMSPVTLRAMRGAFFISNYVAPLPAALVRRANAPTVSLCGTLTGNSSLMFISRTSRGGDRRRVRRTASWGVRLTAPLVTPFRPLATLRG